MGGSGPSGGGPHRLDFWFPLVCLVLNNDYLRARRPWGEDRTAFFDDGDLSRGQCNPARNRSY